MADGTIKIDTLLDESGIKKGLSSLKSIASKGMKGVSIAVGAASTALTTMGGYALKVGSDFEEGMSKVESISGATADEMERLTEKAKEMGAKTKFSATESAAAMEYMAMAGWKTEDMLNGVEGIMNLAAASGEDLATTSDIVTDALTAFGLKASDAAHFSDVLAKASASSNTNVGMMGNTFKYVAPVAGALGYSIEDMALAIGLMANSGIKGEQAGTQLRAVLSRMTKPTDEVDRAMTDLGLSITRSDGSMKSFNEIMLDMRQGFSGLNEEQKATYAAMLGGQEAMSGLLAIVGASDEDFAALAKEINNADGAAQEMAETMQDNLKGQITILKSSLEGLGIEIYESVQEPLKEAAKEGINYVNQITDAFKSGGLQGAIKEAGKVFAELATSAAEQAPAMVDAAVSMIQAFIQGLSKNKTKIIKAAGQFVKTLASGIASLLPKEIQKPVKKMIDDISKSFSSGGLKKAVNTVVKLFKSLGTAISKIAKTVLPVLTKAVDLLGDKLDILIPMIAGVATGLKAWKIAQTVTKLIKDMQKATAASALTLDTFIAANGAAAVATATSTAGITAKTVATGVLNKQIGLATAAQWLWNNAIKANPIGAAITIVTTLATVIGGLIVTMGEEEDQTDSLNEATGRRTEKMQELHDAYVETKEAADEQARAELAQTDHLKLLADELGNLADENGKVKKADQARAKYILGELNEALGTEYEITGDQIENYKELKDSVYDVIAAKQAETLLATYEETYQKAIENRAEADKQASEDGAKLKKQQDQLNEWVTRRDELRQGREEAIANGTYAAWAEANGYMYDAAELRVTQEEDALERLQEAYDQSSLDAQTYHKQISTYEEASVLFQSGKVDEAIALLRKETDGFIKATDLVGKTSKEKEKILKDQYDSLKAKADWYEEQVLAGTEGFTEEELNLYRQHADDALKEWEKVGGNIGEGAESGIDSSKTDVYLAAKELAEKALEGQEDADPGNGISKQNGADNGQGYVNGIRSKIRAAGNAGWDIAKAALNAQKEAQKSNSPSKEAMKLGGDNAEGYALGIEKNAGLASKAAENMVDSALSTEKSMPEIDLMSRFRNISAQDIHTMFQKAKAAVEREAMKIGSAISATVNYSIAATAPVVNTTVMPAPVNAQIYTTVELDGKKVGEGITPYVDESLGAINKRRERGG